MSKMSNYLEEALLNHIFGGTAYTQPSNIYLGLFTSDPTDAGSGTEVSGGSYARQEATWDAAANPTGAITTDADVTFPVASGDWGTVTHIGIFDAVSTGNLLFYGPLTASQVINTGNQFKIPSGQLAVTLA